MKSQRIFALLLLSSASQATLQRCYKSIQRKCIERTIVHSDTLLGSKSLHPTRLDHVNSPSMLPHLHGCSLAEMHEMYRSEITASVILFKYSRHFTRTEGTSIRNSSWAFSSTFSMCRKHMSQCTCQNKIAHAEVTHRMWRDESMSCKAICTSDVYEYSAEQQPMPSSPMQ